MPPLFHAGQSRGRSAPAGTVTPVKSLLADTKLAVYRELRQRYRRTAVQALTLKLINIADAWEEEALGQTFGSGELEPHEQAIPRPSCQWLYRNIAMDATGRVMPCCASPRPDADQVFTSNALEPRHPLNSEKHRQPRASFRHPGSMPDAPFCARCEWNHETVNIGGPEIRRYLLNLGCAAVRPPAGAVAGRVGPTGTRHPRRVKSRPDHVSSTEQIL